jgi:hypothetical protein
MIFPIFLSTKINHIIDYNLNKLKNFKISLIIEENYYLFGFKNIKNIFYEIVYIINVKKLFKYH